MMRSFLLLVPLIGIAQADGSTTRPGAHSGFSPSLHLFISPSSQGQDAIEKLLDRIRTGDFAEREKASEELLSRWKGWSDPELLELSKAAEGSDAELRTRATEALRRIRARRRAPAVATHVPWFDKAVVEAHPRSRVLVLSESARLWRQKQITDADLEAIRRIAADDKWSLPRRDFLWIVDRLHVTPWAAVIVPFLTDEHSILRRDTVATLGSLGDKTHADAVYKALDDEDAGVRLAAAKALGALDVRERIPDLVARLADKNPEDRKAAIVALAALGAKLDEVCERLNDDFDHVRAAAVTATREPRFGDRAAVVRRASLDSLAAAHDGVIPLLKDDAAEVRQAALAAILRLNMKADLRPLLHDVVAPIRALAAETVAIEPAEIAKLLENEDWNVRETAVDLLRRIDGAPVAADIAKLLAHADPGIRATASTALMIARGREAIAGLRPLLKDGETVVRARALKLLVNAAAEDLPVAALLKDSEPEIRVLATALATSAQLAPLLKDTDAEVRGMAAVHLGRRNARDHVAAIGKLLADEDAVVRFHAINALIALRAGPDVLLEAVLRDDSAMAATALESMELAPRHVDQLVARLDGKAPRPAAIALAWSGTRSKIDAVAALLKRPDARRDAVVALGRLGAVEYAPALEALALDDDETLRLVAVEALGEMGAGSATVHALLYDSVRSVRAAAARASGLLGDPALSPGLDLLLSEPDLMVRFETLRAAGRLRLRALAPSVAPHLSSPIYAAYAADALADMGAADFAADVEAAFTRTGSRGIALALLRLGRTPRLERLRADLEPPNRFVHALAAGDLRAAAAEALDRQWAERDLFDRLAAAHEKETVAILAKEIELKKPVATGDDLAEALAPLGLKLDGDVRVAGRLAAGTRAPVSWILERLFGLRGLAAVPEGATLHVLRKDDALRWWLKRLDGR